MYARLDDSLITGNKTIDSQHTELINRINLLVDAIEEDDGQLEAIRLLDYLAGYTEYHFNEEEQLQKQAGYPGFTKHKEQHDEFRNTVKELRAMLQDQGPTPEFVENVHADVIEWLYGHIQGFDCSVATYIHMSAHPDLL